MSFIYEKMLIDNGGKKEIVTEMFPWKRIHFR